MACTDRHLLDRCRPLYIGLCYSRLIIDPINQSVPPVNLHFWEFTGAGHLQSGSPVNLVKGIVTLGVPCGYHLQMDSSGPDNRVCGVTL